MVLRRPRRRTGTGRGAARGRRPEDVAALPDDGRVLVGGPETITCKLQSVLDQTGTTRTVAAVTSWSRRSPPSCG